jgi:adenylate cyclase
MSAKRRGLASVQADGPLRRPDCRRLQRRAARNQHYADSLERRRRVLNIATAISAFVTVCFGILQLLTGGGGWRISIVQFTTAAIFATIPLLHRFGELVAPLVFVGTAFVSIFIISWNVGNGSGLQLYFLVSASLAVLVLGVEHIVLAAAVTAVGAALAITLQQLVPTDTGSQPAWVVTTSFIGCTVTACVMVLATVWYALREIARAEAAMEVEYQRSESLLDNILPASIAARLKDPARDVIADKYEDASILFADIAGFTERASDTAPADLVRFLDRLYTDFDRLVDKHGLEKIKSSGDSYMVVSGVPQPRPDHVEALASLALDMADAAFGLKDPHGRCVPLRIGLAAGPVVAGVVGARRFFYDVWGDAVNIASRMESTDPEGRIQVPQAMYERLRSGFVLEERGDIDVKGKGVMHTWYLVGRRTADADEPIAGSVPVLSRQPVGETG